LTLVNMGIFGYDFNRNINTQYLTMENISHSQESFDYVTKAVI